MRFRSREDLFEHSTAVQQCSGGSERRVKAVESEGYEQSPLTPEVPSLRSSLVLIRFNLQKIRLNRIPLFSPSSDCV